jgi:hypothetical protein
MVSYTVPRTRPRWPPGPLARVPGNHGAQLLAEQVRRAVLGAGRENDPLPDLTPVCAAAGAVVGEEEISARSGGQEALLTPTDNDAFAITVDATPRGGWRPDARSIEAETRRHRVRFRIGHELGHTFFYWRRGDRPLRHLANSARQETFCDLFARALLVPPRAAALSPVTSYAVLELHRAFDVSVEVAARALAAAHPGASVALWFAADESPEPLRLQWCSSAGVGLRPSRDQAIGRADASSRWLPERRQLLLCQP